MSKLLMVFAHGAGASSNSAWMKGWQARLSTFCRVVPFDYPYMREGRKAPDRLPKLIDAHRAALQKARKGHRGRVVLIGKSMGSRVGCHLALEEPIDGIVCLGYPLKGAGKTATLRDDVLLALRVPVMFVQGTRDPLCPVDLLEDVRGRMPSRSSLYLVEGGNHSLEVNRRRLEAMDKTQEDVNQVVLEAIRKFTAQPR